MSHKTRLLRAFKILGITPIKSIKNEHWIPSSTVKGQKYRFMYNGKLGRAIVGKRVIAGDNILWIEYGKQGYYNKTRERTDDIINFLTAAAEAEAKGITLTETDLRQIDYDLKGIRRTRKRTGKIGRHGTTAYILILAFFMFGFTSSPQVYRFDLNTVVFYDYQPGRPHQGICLEQRSLSEIYSYLYKATNPGEVDPHKVMIRWKIYGNNSRWQAGGTWRAGDPPIMPTGPAPIKLNKPNKNQSNENTTNRIYKR